MADIKSLQTLLAELKIHIRARARELDVSPNSLINDLLLTPYSIGGKAIMDQVETVKLLHILSDLESTDLDDEATNYTLERTTGEYSTVTLTFWSTNKPTSNVVIPAVAQARTSGTSFESPVTFSVPSETRFLLSEVDSYYSHDRGRYEFPATAICDVTGTVGNVGAELISVLVTSIDQINGVVNLNSSIDGEGQEIDDDLRERTRLKKTGRELNVSNGAKGYLLGLGFQDAYIIKVEEAGYERASGVDAFVIDSSSAAAQDTFIYDPAKERYYLTKRPVLEVTSVVSAVVGALSSSQYSVNIDSTSPLRRSMLAQDYIEILPTASLAYGTQFTVYYNYASRIYQSQQTLDLPTNEILTADMLIKRAYLLSSYLNATLTLKANADGPTTRNKARNALAQFLAQYTLDMDLQKSDLIIVLQQGFGDYPIESVDAVIISSFHLQDEFGNSYAPVNDTIAVSKKQYVRHGSSNIV